MKQLQDIDFTKAFGDVPESFAARVQYALRCTEKEENAVRRKPLYTIAIVVLLLMLATTAVAAVLSRTIERFGVEYGGSFKTHLEQGVLAPGGQTTEFNGIVFSLDDFVITTRTHEESPQPALNFYATAVISPKEGENIVLMAWDEYTVHDPAGYALFYGSKYPTPPAGAPTYAEIAAENGAVIRRVSCIANGVLDENGDIYPGVVGSALIPQTDGTVLVFIEIVPEIAFSSVQDSYQLSLWLGCQDMDQEGLPIEDSRISMDWVITVSPSAGE
ncbi:MAG: hypothetical protein IJ438_01275 [Clostridia bacterium]|nr:hypothetical protein [Clostridia bacterium]